MRTAIVLVMHGVPPKDFPRRDISELMGLHARLENPHLPPAERESLAARFAELDHQVRTWPRSAENDRFFAASRQLAAELAGASDQEVFLGFNEFCAPDVPEALAEAVASGAERVVVITPMMTPGGEHSDVEIPGQIEEARGRYPETEFVYAWPYQMRDVAGFLAERVRAAVVGLQDE
jgi:sirohydrochlorin cobaltochelatase